MLLSFQPHLLQIDITISSMAASVGSFAVRATAGMAALMSGWNRAFFDNFEWRV